MPNILLTGATGFIGSNILNAIELNNKVFVTQRLKSKTKIKKSKNIKILKFKILNLYQINLKKLKSILLYIVQLIIKRNIPIKIFLSLRNLILCWEIYYWKISRF